MPFHLEVLQLDQWFLLLQPAHYLPHRPMIWWRRRRRDHAMRFMRTMWMIMRLNMGSENPNAFFCFPANHAIYLVVLSAVTPRTLPTICQSKKRAMITIPTSPWRRTIRHIISRGPWNSIQHQLLFCRIIPILKALNKQVEVGLVRCCSARGRQIGDNSAWPGSGANWWKPHAMKSGSKVNERDHTAISDALLSISDTSSGS